MRVLGPDARLLSINTATLGFQWPLRRVMEACAARGIGGVGPWRRDLEAIGAVEAGRIARDLGLVVTDHCRGGMFPAATAAERQARIDDNRRAIDEARALGARSLCLVVGGLPPGSRDIAGARAMVEDGIAAVLPHARAAGVPLAIEPLHPMYAADRACVNTLDQAVAMANRLGDGVGVCLDAYHVWWDPDLAGAIARAGRRILAFHVCDWLVPTRDLLEDRGMMGDGVIDLRRIRRLVEAEGYDGLVEVEIFSAQDWWKRDPADVLDVCVERFATVC
jgi:sugar phosphate isomerase/epimerase